MKKNCVRDNHYEPLCFLEIRVGGYIGNELLLEPCREDMDFIGERGLTPLISLIISP